jgi:two-component system, sensor histidine kinase and response regulator
VSRVGQSEDVLKQTNIMIVDDNPANLKLLEDMLVQRGYGVGSFPLGRLALAAAAMNPPDLILLDINMPEMNGYQVCEHLKATAELSDIPVIFLSALNETRDKLSAFRSGAVDYVSKPFQFEEVYARVETHLQLHALQQALKLDNERLEEVVAARTTELAEANRRLTILDRSKSDFLSLISHEFRTPLNGLLGVGELILDQMPPTEENNELQLMFERSRQRILSMLDDALLLAQIDVKRGNFTSAPVCLRGILDRATNKVARFAESRSVTLSRLSGELELVQGDQDLLVRAFQALVETAVKFSTEGETVRLFCEPGSVTIESCGRSIPTSALGKFFDVFSIAEAVTPGGDLGVGPALAHRILSLFGGSVSVANCSSPGIKLTISFRERG